MLPVISKIYPTIISLKNLPDETRRQYEYLDKNLQPLEIEYYPTFNLSISIDYAVMRYLINIDSYYIEIILSPRINTIEISLLYYDGNNYFCILTTVIRNGQYKSYIKRQLNIDYIRSIIQSSIYRDQFKDFPYKFIKPLLLRMEKKIMPKYMIYKLSER